MKTMIKMAALTATTLMVTGCAFNPTAGIIYSGTQVPVAATSVGAAQVITGESDTCTSVLGLVATGNCSVESAKANSGITNVSTVDYKVSTILGIVSSGTTVITGTK